MGANKWRHVAQLEAETLEGQLHLVQLLIHIHNDLVAIRAHLGIARPECIDPEAAEAEAPAESERPGARL